MANNIEIDFSYAQQAWQEAGGHFTGTAVEWRRPSVIFHPRLFVDGNKYCALFGDNLQDGCGGFGNTPDEAMRDFDKNWETQTIKINTGNKQ